MIEYSPAKTGEYPSGIPQWVLNIVFFLTALLMNGIVYLIILGTSNQMKNIAKIKQSINEKIISPPSRLTLVSGIPKFTGSEGRRKERRKERNSAPYLPHNPIWKHENSKRLWRGPSRDFDFVLFFYVIKEVTALCVLDNKFNHSGKTVKNGLIQLNLIKHLSKL